LSLIKHAKVESQIFRLQSIHILSLAWYYAIIFCLFQYVMNKNILPKNQPRIDIF